VRYVLEGSVRKAGGRVRITGQLIDGQSAGHMWADRFDGSIDDVFDLQDRIATAIVGAVVPRLDQAEIERATTKRTSNLDSYDHLLRGLAKLHLLNRGGAAAALDHFRAAIALDPNSSAAHAWASFTYMRRRQGRWMDDVERESREGMLFGKRAIELAKDDALALAAGGLAIAFMGDDLDAGLAFVDRALNVNPNLALGWQVSGWVRTYIGDPDTAIEHLTHAMRLSPLDPQMPQLCIAMAVAMRCAGRYLDSATWARKALQETPDLLPALIGLAAASALAGQPDDARRAAQRALEVDPGLRIALYNHNLSFRRAEDREAMTNGLRSAGIPD
jgi:tetratricopeptide (TPR) repeat protein